jgi:ATP-dependent Lon protease
MDLKKLAAALIPDENVKDLDEIDKTVRGALKFIPCSSVGQVLANALI